MRKSRLLRTGIFLFVALLHGAALFFLVFAVEPSRTEPEPPLTVMKLVDIQEELPPPLPPPPAVSPPPAENVVETIAENMAVVEEVPEEQVLAEPGAVIPAPIAAPEPEAYLSQSKISRPPLFSEEAIKRVLTYPSIAQRSGIEGAVILELFIDREGVVQRVFILKETPPDRGFGEAAAKAFLGQRCVPAESNGAAVGVRYRYPVRFQLN